MNIAILHEPALEFRYEQRVADPHHGLTLFGPVDTDDPGHPKNIRYAVIGTPAGTSAFRTFSDILAKPVTGPRSKLRDALLWPAYPGFEAAYASTWTTTPVATETIDEAALLANARRKDPNQRTYRTVDAYIAAIERLAQRDEHLDIIICIVPEEIWKNCRPQSIVPHATGTTPSRADRELRRQQTSLFGEYDPEEYEYSVDFRRQLKARAMPTGVPLQILRDTTLRTTDQPTDDRRGLTPLSDRAWNLSTALYYKAGGKPWRLATARPGVCYIGIAFRRTDPTNTGSTSACCAAQMFLDTGDGVVFRGEYGPWYSPEHHDFHLTKESAQTLLQGVIKTYHNQGGQDLKEIFLHARSSISDDEFAGYQEACPPSSQLVGIRVRTDRNGLRAYRQGTYPVMRGTLWPTSDRRAYLWTTGYKPSLLTYDGWETPAPLRIDIQHGNAPIERVANDILGLTKLNYNACKLGDAEPVTILFSDHVGEILITNPRTTTPRPNFKYYI